MAIIIGLPTYGRLSVHVGMKVLVPGLILVSAQFSSMLTDEYYHLST